MHHSLLSPGLEVPVTLSPAGQTSLLLVGAWKDPDPALAVYLRSRDYQVEDLASWRDALPLFPHRYPDLILLDLALTGVGSLAVIVSLREVYHGPLIVLADHDDETCHILALEFGANDFLGGTLSYPLLAARMAALLRSTGQAGSARHRTIIALGELIIDAGRREITVRGHAIELTTAEFDLLWYLAGKAGSVVSRSEITLALRQREYNGTDRSIDMYVSRLRQKLGDDPLAPRLLKTVRGSGYLLNSHGL